MQMFKKIMLIIIASSIAQIDFCSAMKRKSDQNDIDDMRTAKRLEFDEDYDNEENDEKMSALVTANLAKRKPDDNSRLKERTKKQPRFESALFGEENEAQDNDQETNELICDSLINGFECFFVNLDRELFNAVKNLGPSETHKYLRTAERGCMIDKTLTKSILVCAAENQNSEVMNLCIMAAERANIIQDVLAECTFFYAARNPNPEIMNLCIQAAKRADLIQEVLTDGVLRNAAKNPNQEVSNLCIQALHDHHG